MTSQELGNLTFFAKSAHISAIIIASSFYTFTLLLFERRSSIAKNFTTTFVITLILIIFTALTNKIIYNFEFTESGPSIVYGKAFITYVLCILTFFILGYYNLLKIFTRKAEASSKHKTALVFLGYFLSGIVAIPTNLILPYYYGFFDLIWLGPIATLFLTTLLTYAIRRHGLFNVKIFNIEIFVLLLWLILSMGLIVRTDTFSVFDFMFSGLFILSGVLLLRKVKFQEEERSMQNILTQQLIDEVKTKDRLTSLITHNIASPLTSINFLAEDLSDSQDIKPLIDNLTWKIKDLINISNLKNEKVEEKSKIMLNDLLFQVLDQRESMLARKNITVQYISENIQISFSKTKLFDTIMSILNNLIRYNSTGNIYIEQKRTSENKRLELHFFDFTTRLHPKCPNELVKKFSERVDLFEASILSSDIGLYIAKESTKMQGGELIIDVSQKPEVRFILKIDTG